VEKAEGLVSRDFGAREKISEQQKSLRDGNPGWLQPLRQNRLQSGAGFGERCAMALRELSCLVSVLSSASALGFGGAFA